MNIFKSLVIFVMTIFSFASFAGVGSNFLFFPLPGLKKLVFTTAPQSILASSCSALITVKSVDGAGATLNVGTDLTVSLAAASPSMTFYSDDDCSLPISTTVISNGTSTSSFYMVNSAAGGLDISALASSYESAVQSHTFLANNFIWTGGGGNANWSTASNWSGGIVPTVSDRATFDATCVTNCSPTITSTTTVGGIRMSLGFSGTITQGSGAVFNVSNLGWVQVAGAFVGSSTGDAMNLTGTRLTLRGGNFTATSGTMTINTDFNTGWGGTVYETITAAVGFSHNSGNIVFTTWLTGNINIDFADSINLWNLSLRYTRHDVNTTYNVPTTTTLSVLNDFTIGNTGPGGNVRVKGGAINVAGNLYATDNASSGSTIIKLTSTGNQTYSCIATGIFPQIEINKPSGTVTPAAGVTDCGFSNFKLLQGSFTAVTGQIVIDTSEVTGWYAYSPTFEIDAGTTFNHNSGTFTLTNYYGGTINVNVDDSINLWNFGLRYSRHDSNVTYALATGKIITVANDLTIGNTGTGGYVVTNGGKLNVKGNISIANNGGAGSTPIKISGTATQTYTVASGSTPPQGIHTVNKLTGTLVLGSNLNVSLSSNAFTLLKGSVDLAGFDLTVYSISLNANTLTKNAGVLTVGGSVVGTGALYGGTVDP